MRRYRREFANSSIRILRTMLDLISAIHSLRNEGYNNDKIAKHLDIDGAMVRNILLAIAPSCLGAPVSADAENNSLLSDVVHGKNIGFDELESDDNIDYYIQKLADSMKDENRKGIWYDYIYSAVLDSPIHQNVLAKKYKLSQSYVGRILMDGKIKMDKFMQPH